MSARVTTLLPLTLLACVPQARFEDASATQREAAIHTAVGTGPALGFVAVISLEQDAVTSVIDGGCLDAELVDQDPPVVRIAAEDCVGASGVTWDGVATLTNVSLTAEILEVVDGDVQIIEGPMALAFEAFSMRGDGYALTLDGTVAQSASEWGAPYRSTVDLEAGLGALALDSEFTQDCEYRDDAAWCDVEPGARGGVPDLGRFAIEGGFTLGGPGVAPSGAIVLRGVDEMRVDLDALDEDGCARVTVDGEPVEPFCLASAGPVDPHPDHAIVSGGLGCTVGSWFLDTTVEGEGVATVRATLYAGDAAAPSTEVHALPFGSTGDTGDFYQASIAIGAYEAGVSSAFACAADDTGVTSADVLFEAVAADGEVLACAVVGQGGRVPPAACTDPG